MGTCCSGWRALPRLDVAVGGRALGEALKQRSREAAAQRLPRWGTRGARATGIFVRFPTDGPVSYVSAGHPPILVRCGDETIAEFGPTGYPLALMDRCEARERPLELTPGDTALLYTDGLMEAGDADGHPFGMSRLA